MITLRKQLVLLLPAIASALLFGGAFYSYILPKTESAVLERRKETVKNLTNTAYSLITSYYSDVQSGKLSKPEAQANALFRLGMMRYGPENKDYYWVNDLEGVVLMHPYRTDLVGKNLMNMQDSDGVRMFSEFVRVSKEEGHGYVAYRWQHYNEPAEAQKKISYVRLFQPWGWVIGTGCYLQDVDEELSILAWDITLLGAVIWLLVAGLSISVMYRQIRYELARSQADEAIRESEQRLSEIIDFLPDPTWVIDVQGKVVAWNQAVARLTGITSKQVKGRSGYRYAVAFYGEPRLMLIDQVLKPNQSVEKDYSVFQRDGSRLYGEFFVPNLGPRGIYLASTAGPLYDHKGKLVGAIQTVRDITRRKRMEQELLELATKDSLTGVNNRHHFMELARDELKRYRRHKRPMAMMMLDLDHFKNVNDSHGHHVGDKVLVAFSRVCQSVIRETDYLGRLGGEEFGVLLVDSSLEDSCAVAERIRKTVEETDIPVDGLTLNITVSVGLTMLTRDDQRFKVILQRADRALYQAKNAGRNQVVRI